MVTQTLDPPPAQEHTREDVAASRRSLASPEDVSEYLGVPLSTIYLWRRKGIGPRWIPVGKYIRARWVDIESWLDEQAEGNPA